MKFFWGHPNNYINVTKICYEKFLSDNSIIINKGEDFKLNIFGDPIPGLIKHIKVIDSQGNYSVYNYNDEDIIINIHDIFPKVLNIYWNDFNITDICMKKCLNQNTIKIPHNDDDKINLFGDPYPGINKKIKIIDKLGNIKIFLDNNKININIMEESISLGWNCESAIKGVSLGIR